MSGLKNGQVKFIGYVINIKLVTRGQKGFQLNLIHLDTGKGDNPLIEIEAKKDDPLIKCDVCDKVELIAWVNGREHNDRVYTSLYLAGMEVIERANAVPKEEVQRSVEDEQGREDSNLPF